jgi:hypothetical protein
MLLTITWPTGIDIEDKRALGHRVGWADYYFYLGDLHDLIRKAHMCVIRFIRIQAMKPMVRIGSFCCPKAI